MRASGQPLVMVIMTVIGLGIGVTPARCPAQAQGQSETATDSPSSRRWEITTHPSQASLRGLCVVDATTIWASGSDGTVLKTIDGGSTWTHVGPNDMSKLDFRDIHAWDGARAVIASAGSPARIYVTVDGGVTWEMVHEDLRKPVFYDAMDFDNEGRGVLFSDPVDGRLLILTTGDRGQSWQELPREMQPAALEAEAGFAASGSCLCIVEGTVMIGLGGAHSGADGTARIVSSNDGMRNWDVVDSALPTGEASGVFSLAFTNRDHGVAVGGNYLEPKNARGTASYTTDGGRHWHVAAQPPRGYRSGAASRPGGRLFLAVGPSGCDQSSDNGQTWSAFDDTGFHAVAFAPDGSLAVATGGEGRIGICRDFD